MLGKCRRKHASQQSQVVQFRRVDAGAVEVDDKIGRAGQLLDQIQLRPGPVLGFESAVLGHNEVGAFRQGKVQLVIRLRLVGF